MGRGNRILVTVVLAGIFLVSFGAIAQGNVKEEECAIRSFMDAYSAQWGYHDSDWTYVDSLTRGIKPQGQNPHYAGIPRNMTQRGYEQLIKDELFPLMDLRGVESEAPKLHKIVEEREKWVAHMTVGNRPVTVHFKLIEEDGIWKIDEVFGLHNLIG